MDTDIGVTLNNIKEQVRSKYQHLKNQDKIEDINFSKNYDKVQI